MIIQFFFNDFSYVALICFLLVSLPVRKAVMFIRERSHKLKNGTKGYGYSLCQARSINGNATSFTVLNLGADFDVPKGD